MSVQTEKLKEAIDKFDEGNIKESSSIIDNIMTDEVRSNLFGHSESEENESE